MVCYICGKPASFRCPVCERYVCSEHTLRDIPRLICSKCFDLARQKEKEEQQDKYYHIHHCDFHKCYHDDKYLESQKWHSKSSKSKKLDIVYCDKCEKQICIDSAIKGETKEFRHVDPYGEHGSDFFNIAPFKITKYLCSICRNVVFLNVDIWHEEDSGNWWRPYKRYTITEWIPKYGSAFGKEWVLHQYLNDLFSLDNI